MPRKKGGKIASDGRAPSFAPGARNDLSAPAGTQPIAAPGGLPYGQNKQLQDSQRVMPLPDVNAAPGGSGGPQTGAAPLVPLNAPTQFPNQPVTARPPSPSALSAEEASMALEEIIGQSNGAVSVALLRLLNDLKKEALYSPSAGFDGDEDDALGSLL